MVTYGFPRIDVRNDLLLAQRLGAQVVEVLPAWRTLPDPGEFRRRVADLGLEVHSAHGCWGGQAIRASRVDLGEPHLQARGESVEDLKRCLDWLHRAGGCCLVVHPGGLSDRHDTVVRRAALSMSLTDLAEHAREAKILVCVENMPPGVHPGSRMAELQALLVEIGHPWLALALDTGHAHITSSAPAETRAAGALLRTTHVHDNDGRQDTHLPPGLGTVDWPSWVEALDEIGYAGPIILECIRHLRDHPECLGDALLNRFRGMTSTKPLL
jgi:sugar phosphate isomerase/epimerase